MSSRNETSNAFRCNILRRKALLAIPLFGEFVPCRQVFGNDGIHVGFYSIGFMDGNAIFKGSRQSDPLCLLCILHHDFKGLTAGDASGQVGAGSNKAALIRVGYDLHAVRQSQIFFKLLRASSPHFRFCPACAGSPHRSAGMRPE